LTPLYIACEKGHESTVLVLLQNGADLNLQNKVTSRRMMIMMMMKVMIMIIIAMMMIDDTDSNVDR
jgi:ankyrin repeat protein